MKKVFISGSIIEIYEYQGYICGKGGRMEKTTGEQEEKNYKSRVIQRRNMVRRLACSNFNNQEVKFVTLTFKENKTNVQECNNEFKKFIKRLKYNFNLQDIKYLAVIEFQKRGAIHYHCLMNIPYISFLELQSTWGNGFIHIEDVTKVDNLGAYLVKYMTKENADDRLMGEKGYLTSRNLIRPIEVSDKDLKAYKIFERNHLEKLDIKKCTPVYETDYETEMLGKCHYTQYNLERTQE